MESTPKKTSMERSRPEARLAGETFPLVGCRGKAPADHPLASIAASATLAGTESPMASSASELIYRS